MRKFFLADGWALVVGRIGYGEFYGENIYKVYIWVFLFIGENVIFL